jgi:hypothetical protein
MFVQVIQGKVADEAGLRAAMDGWRRDCGPGAIGWLGSTAGFTDDGDFIAVVRFESPEAAQRNNQRPEQDAWWAEASKCFAGDVTFIDSSDVTTWLAGGSDDAGFVQIIQGHFQHPDQMTQMMEQHSDELATMRPEIIGGNIALQPDGAYVQVIYFTSEAEARKGESVPPPPEVAELMSAEMQDASFIDLHQPMMMSPG